MQQEGRTRFSTYWIQKIQIIILKKFLSLTKYFFLLFFLINPQQKNSQFTLHLHNIPSPFINAQHPSAEFDKQRKISWMSSPILFFIHHMMMKKYLVANILDELKIPSSRAGGSICSPFCIEKRVNLYVRMFIKFLF